LPLTGYVVQEGAATGVYGDGWIAPGMTIQVRPVEPVTSVTLRAFRPEHAGGGRLRMLVDGVEVTNSELEAGSSEVTASFTRDEGETFTLEVNFDAYEDWKPQDDGRDLALIVTELRVGHAAPEIRRGVDRSADGLVYIAKRLADAKRLEELFTASDVEYEVAPEMYQGGVIFRSARVGAFFYVAPEIRAQARAVLIENGFVPLK
jgi:hypothetical protein